MTKPSTTATQRSLREVIADDSHALTFQTSGQYRAALLKHEPIEHTHHTEAFAWAVFAKDDNVIIWSKNRAQVESASKEYGRPIVPVIALPAAQQAAVPAMHPALQHAFVVSAGAWFSARKLLEDDQHPNVVLAWECMLGCLSFAAQQAAAPDGPLINEGTSAPGTPEAPKGGA